MIITEITCLVLEYLSTSDDYEMNTGASKLTHFEPTIKT